MEKTEAIQLLEQFDNKVPIKLKPGSSYKSGSSNNAHVIGIMVGLNGSKAIVQPRNHRRTEQVPLSVVIKWEKGMHMSNAAETAAETETTTTEEDLTARQKVEIIQSSDYLVCSYDKDGNIVYWDGFKWRRNYENGKQYKARGAKLSRTKLNNNNRGNGIFITKLPSVRYGVFKLEFDDSAADVANVPAASAPATAPDTAPATAPATTTDTAATTAPDPAPAPEAPAPATDTAPALAAVSSTEEDLLCHIQCAMEAVNAAQAMYLEEKSKLELLKMRFELITR